MNFSKSLSTLLRAENLNSREAESVFHSLFSGNLPEYKAKALLLLLAAKNETSDEIYGCLSALKKLEPPKKSRVKNLIDTCGTGGDGSHSINVSTLAAFVIAGAGGKVAKHGNRSITSKCGSSDLIEAFGISLEAGVPTMSRAIEKAGIGYFHAPFHHPVFSKVQSLRKKLKIRTIFNFLGPLSNPLQISSQVLGVSRPEDFARFVEVLKKTGGTAFVCHSNDGLDEISVAAPTRFAFIKRGGVKLGVINPARYKFKKTSLSKLKGGSLQTNTAIARKILAGKLKGPAREIVILNAAAGLWISGIAKNFSDGIKKASESLDSGNAYESLRKLQAIAGKGRS